MEINFVHGDALSLADQVFLFKRTCARRRCHNMCAFGEADGTPPAMHPPEHRRHGTEYVGYVSRGCRSTRPR